MPNTNYGEAMFGFCNLGKDSCLGEVLSLVGTASANGPS